MIDRSKMIIQDFFSFLEGNLVEVLECLSTGKPWQNNVVGYELSERLGGDECFEGGIMLFMQTSFYSEIVMQEQEFYNYLKQTCKQYLLGRPHEEQTVAALLKKVQKVFLLN